MLGRRLVRDLDDAFRGVELAPVFALRCRRQNFGLHQFLEAYLLAAHGLGGYDVPRDAPHIRARAKANRRANKAARAARRRNR